ncbi:MAG TPA: hypothetical protein VHJ38_18415 [Nitrososphaeraceae archaeon]|nr:hypothetical protein [Nitrososphaeraceae archaeon]
MISREIHLIFLLSILLFVSFDISSDNHIVLGEEDSKSSDGDDDRREKEKEDSSDGDDDRREKEKEDSSDGDDDVPFILPIPFP